MPPEEEDDDEESFGEEKEEELSRRDFIIFLARDIAFAVILVGIVIGALFAYAQVWPPMVVVESGSMQHSGVQSYLGVIDTGDLVLLQGIGSASDVVTYVQGRGTGYETYSNYGDVIVFHPPGASLTVTPIIHRAIVYVEYPSAFGPGVDIPSLEGFPASEWSWTNFSGSQTSPAYNLRTITLQVRSWHTGSESVVSVNFDLNAVRSRGFLTKGDHNANPESLPPVPASAIIGKARGELPWFGLIKLTIWPTTGCCPGGWGDTGRQGAPRNSWDSLATSLLMIPLAIFLADYGVAFVEKYWKSYRKKRKEAAASGGEEGTALEETATESDDAPR